MPQRLCPENGKGYRMSVMSSKKSRNIIHICIIPLTPKGLFLFEISHRNRSIMRNLPEAPVKLLQSGINIETWDVCVILRIRW